MSMLDEAPEPSTPKFWVCCCCVLTFNDKAVLLAHYEEMKRRIDAAVAKVQK